MSLDRVRQTVSDVQAKRVWYEALLRIDSPGGRGRLQQHFELADEEVDEVLRLLRANGTQDALG